MPADNLTRPQAGRPRCGVPLSQERGRPQPPPASHVGATFPLERAADAHRALEAGQVIGKVVLTMDA